MAGRDVLRVILKGQAALIAGRLEILQQALEFDKFKLCLLAACSVFLRNIERDGRPIPGVKEARSLNLLQKQLKFALHLDKSLVRFALAQCQVVVLLWRERDKRTPKTLQLFELQDSPDELDALAARALQNA